MSTPAAAAAFVEDYTYLREAGLNHTQIAERLGIQRESLLRRTLRNGCYLPERHELPVVELLDRLVAAGQPFQVHQHFGRFDRGVVAGVITRAHRAGRITPAGTAFDGQRHEVRVWVSAESAGAVAS